jgi:hypothetical protein
MLAQAQAERRNLAVQTTAERPASNAHWSAAAALLLNDAVRDVRTSLLVLLGAGLFVQLLGCVNVANLYLMRTNGRVRGAGRGRLVHQLVAESLLIALTGGLLGIALAYAGVRGLLAVLLSGIGSAWGVYRGDRPTLAPGTGPSAGFSVVSDGYFQTMGIPVLTGRGFTERDRMGAPLVAVINQAAVRLLYPGETPSESN